MGTDPTKFIIKGKIVTPDQVIDGELIIEGDTITCVAASCTDAPPASPSRMATSCGSAVSFTVLISRWSLGADPFGWPGLDWGAGCQGVPCGVAKTSRQRSETVAMTSVST